MTQQLEQPEYQDAFMRQPRTNYCFNPHSTLDQSSLGILRQIHIPRVLYVIQPPEAVREITGLILCANYLRFQDKLSELEPERKIHLTAQWYEY